MTEYALSGAILAVDLTALNGMPIKNDNGRSYIYDIPTLDDPSRLNIDEIIDPDAPGYTGIDIGDPFGGNDGLNQAMIVDGGPVQIFSPGYRNAYDLVVTKKGAVYVTDNGANEGWGGFPENEGTANVTNNYVLGEPGSASPAPDGEYINNKDHLTLVTNDIQNYVFGSFYGGHPNPVRANPAGAGLYSTPDPAGNDGAVFRTMVYDPDGSTPGSTNDPTIGLPANWPPVPVPMADPREGDWRGPGENNPDGPDDDLVVVWPTNTNSLVEYTSAIAFDGALEGNLLAGNNGNKLHGVSLNEDGSLKLFDNRVATNFNDNPLGVASNGDDQIFPGTVWVGIFHGNGGGASTSSTITVLEPAGFVNCIDPSDPAYDALADYDDDGYTNQDEVDNGSDPCNGAIQPDDFDKSASSKPYISDLNDDDDDNDGILDKDDPFQLGDPNTTGSDAFALPVVNQLFSSSSLGGYQGLGMTGLMNNGDPGKNWLNWLDDRDAGPNPNDIVGGAIGAMTMQMTSGTALGATNTQEKGFQYGVQVDQTTVPFTVVGNMVNFDAPLQLYGNTNAPNGELGFFIGDGTQKNYIKFVLTQSGFTVLQEINDVPQTPINLGVSVANRPTTSANFYMDIDPSSGAITLEYDFDGGTRQPVGTLNAQGGVLTAIQQAGTDLAVGLIGTSNAPGVEVEGTWGYLNVLGGQPIVSQELPNLTRLVNTGDEDIDLTNYFVDNQGAAHLIYTITNNTDPNVNAVINGTLLTLSYPGTPTSSDITIKATDIDGNFVEQIFSVYVINAPKVLYRVNSGGPEIAAKDGDMAWGADTAAGNSPYLSVPAGNKVGSYGMNSYTSDVNQTTTPVSIFDTERYDNEVGNPEMTYSFPVPEEGNYEVRLYMGNGWSGTADPGKRIFDVQIEGVVYPKLNELDLSATYGSQVGTMISHIVHVTDGTIDVKFIHGAVENPLVNGIEILDAPGPDTPIYVAQIPDQTNHEGEILKGDLTVSAFGGDGNLNYSAVGLPPGIFLEPTNGQLGGAFEHGAKDNSPYNVIVTVDDNDSHSTDAVTLNFTWTVTGEDSYRINAGGAAVTATDVGPNWEDNATKNQQTGINYTVNTGVNVPSGLLYNDRDASIPAYIDEATFNTLFAQERYDDVAAPEMEYKLPVTNGLYVVNLYMGNSWSGTQNVGDRVFDIEMEGKTVEKNLDLISKFGHQVGGMISYPVEVTDGELNIKFLHGPTENPVIDAIEVLDSFNPLLTFGIVPIADRTNSVGEEIELKTKTYGGSLGIPVTYKISGQPSGININAGSGLISGTVDAAALTGGTLGDGVHEVTVTATQGSDIVTTTFVWTVTPFTSLRINAGGAAVTATDGKSDWLENATPGAYAGQDYSVNTGKIYAGNLKYADRHVSIPSTMDEATYDALFANERYDEDTAPEMEFAVPLANGNYMVHLYIGNSFEGTNEVGDRKYDILFEGNVVKSDFDPVAQFGASAGGMLSIPVTLTDGVLNIGFGRKIENPLIDAIEIGPWDGNSVPFGIYDIADQYNTEGQTIAFTAGTFGGDINSSVQYGISDQPQGISIDPTNGLISGTIDPTAVTGGPNGDGVYPNVTVTAEQGGTVIQTIFKWTVATFSTIRINAGGALVAATDGKSDWLANETTGSVTNANYSVNTGLIYDDNLKYEDRDVASIPSYIDEATFNAIFKQERYDVDDAPEMEFKIPIENGNYKVNLFFGNSFEGTNTPGKRSFDVSFEGVVQIDDFDPVAAFGNLAGGMVSRTVTVTDGELNIQFLHQTENTQIYAIEVGLDDSEFDPVVLTPIADQFSQVGDTANGLVASATGGDSNENFTYSISGQPDGIGIDPATGDITGTITAAAATGGSNGDGAHQVMVTATKPGSSPQSINFTWVVGFSWHNMNEATNYTARHECSFVQAGDKFYLMGGREDAENLDVYDYTTNTWNTLTNSLPVVNGTQLKFNHFQAVEYQGLIWVIGAFKTNIYHSEKSADYIWAFDPANQEWIQGPEIPEGRKRGSAGLVMYNDKFYIVGGNNDGHNPGYQSWFDEYDPATGIWTTLTDAPHARDHFSAVVIGDKLYAAGGRQTAWPDHVWDQTISEVDVYDFTTSTWSTLPSDQNIPTPRAGTSAVNFNDKLVVIGGEVENVDVYGTVTSDALKITEQFDPAMGTWSRLADMNYPRHATQAIVSGPGIFTTAGSNIKGGSPQKNMEYLGANNPTGVASVASILSAPTDVDVPNEGTRDFDIMVENGNVGIIVRSMSLSGPNASDYSIDAGELANALLKPGATHTITVGLSGTGANRTAVLTINYGANSSMDINLTNNNIAPVVTNPGNQNNNEGDVVSLQIGATDASSNLTYAATGLPDGLSVDSNTGLISGVVAVPQVGNGAFEEQNGRVVVEAESGDVVSSWTEATTGGATGIKAGSDHFSTQNGGTIPYKIKITTPGVYRFNWRSFYNGASSTDENDTWLRFPNNNDVWFFGLKGSVGNEASIIANLQGAQTNVVFPGGTARQTAATKPDGSSTNGYFKIYRSGGSSQVYDWQAKTSDNDGHDIYLYFVNSGTYTMEISERSAGHTIDKFALYKVDGTNYTDAELTVAPESPHAQDSPGASANSPYHVEVTVTDEGTPTLDSSVEFDWIIGDTEAPIAKANATPLTGDAPLEVQFTGSNSTDDVAITDYTWDFKDGTPNVNYADPIHIFTTAGQYVVELTVTDADGQTDTAMVTIDVTTPTGNQPPVVTGLDDQNNVEGATPSLQIVATDPENGTLTYTATGLPNGLSIDSSTGLVSGTIAAGASANSPYSVDVKVTDDGSPLESDSVQFTWNVGVSTGNEAPVAVIGAVPISGPAPLEIQFTGSGSTDDVAIVEYLWDFKDGSTSNEANPSHTFNAAGQYEVELKVTDGEGLTDTATTTIDVTVPEDNLPPIVTNPGEQNNTEESIVSLQIVATDPEMGILNYAATGLPDGLSIDSATGLISGTIATGASVSSPYSVEIMVTDDGNPTGSTSMQFEWKVISSTGNQPPEVANPGELNNIEGETPSLQIVATDPEMGVLTYSATGLPMGLAIDSASGIISGTIATGASVNSPYSIEVTVTDDGSPLESASVQFTWNVTNPNNQPPMAVAKANPITGVAPLPVIFKGDASTDDIGITKYFWDFKDGFTASSVNTNHEFTTPGTYEVELTVTDGGGLTDTTRITITVVADTGNEAPIAVLNANPESGEAPLIVHFTGSESTDDVGVTTYLWNFDDGSSSDQADPAHTFTEERTYNVELTVTDAEGLTNTGNITITVMGKVKGIIYPNPAKDVAKVSIDNLPADKFATKIYIHDATGRYIATLDAQSSMNIDGEYEIPVYNLENGVYFVGFEFNEGESMVLKLLVRK